MICWIIVNVRWERLAIIRSYLSIIASLTQILGQFLGHGWISRWRIHLSAGCFAIPSYWSTMHFGEKKIRIRPYRFVSMEYQKMIFTFYLYPKFPEIWSGSNSNSIFSLDLHQLSSLSWSRCRSGMLVASFSSEIFFLLVENSLYIV